MWCLAAISASGGVSEAGETGRCNHRADVRPGSGSRAIAVFTCGSARLWPRRRIPGTAWLPPRPRGSRSNTG